MIRARDRTEDDPARRRFTALDAILIICSFGIGVLWASQTVPIFIHLAANDDTGPYQLVKLTAHFSFAYHSLLLQRSLHTFAAFLAPPTFALLLLRFRRPRPPIRRCFRQPGAMACAAASMPLCLEVLNHFLNLAIRFNTTRLTDDLATRYLLFAPRLADASLPGGIAFWMGESSGWVVAGAYLALWAAGLWRSEPSWLDRTGRALAWVWIITALAFVVLPLTD
ncbi:MAG TPA: hypothetical protein VKA15_21180 [Isosphaeraceae bacterium]|nr:hypothetical protein [Isosphaeraceae bacterium]